MSGNDKIYTASFFYVFDLAEFFSNDKNSTEFLDSRTDKRFHELFSYKDGGKENEPSNDNLKEIGPFEYCEEEWKKEGKAYLAGWVRLNLLHQFFHPTYDFKTNDKSKPNGGNILSHFCSSFGCGKETQSSKSDTNIFEELLSNDADKGTLKRIKGKYKDHWYDKIKDDDHCTNFLSSNLKLYISVSRYGTISLRIEGKIPITSVGTLNGSEFSQTKVIISSLLHSPNGFGGEVNAKFHNYHPSLIDFIALIAIWEFINELKGKVSANVPHLCEWRKNVGETKCFSKIWKKCISGQFDISHELSYFYFQDPLYQGISHYPEKFIDNMCSLGRFVFSNSNEDIHFSSDVIERVRHEELSITNNGSAHILAGTSLIVTVDDQSYKLQGMGVNEKEFWDWMFRLLCCLRECYVLAGICSSNLRELSKNDKGPFESIYRLIIYSLISFAFLILLLAAILIFVPDIPRKTAFLIGAVLLVFVLVIAIIHWKNFNKLKNNVSKLSNLLFTIEESINSITSSKMPAVQEKLQVFTERMGLNSLIENLNKRRIILETKISQSVTEMIGIVSIYVAFIAFVIATLSLINDISDDKMKEKGCAIKLNCQTYNS